MIVESVSKPSTNSPMMRKIRQVSLTAKSSIGSRRGGSRVRSLSEFRRGMLGRVFRVGKLSALLGAVGQPVLAQVVGEVARVDPEQPGRLLAQAARPALRLQEKIALQARQGLAEVQLASRGGGLPRGRRRRGRREQVQVLEGVRGIQ